MEHSVLPSLRSVNPHAHYAKFYLRFCAISVLSASRPIRTRRWRAIQTKKVSLESKLSGILFSFVLRAKSVRDHSIIVATAPEPTVWPPSLIAKRRPCSIATLWISSTVISTLSPGMHISVPAGSSQTPVTSVVLK